MRNHIFNKGTTSAVIKQSSSIVKRQHENSGHTQDIKIGQGKKEKTNCYFTTFTKLYLRFMTLNLKVRKYIGIFNIRIIKI